RVVHQLAVPVGRSRVGALALPGRRAGPRPVRAPHRPPREAHPRREPVRRARRPHPAPGARPRRRADRLRALPLLALPDGDRGEGARSPRVRHLEPPPHPPAVSRMTTTVQAPPPTAVPAGPAAAGPPRGPRSR